MNTKKTTCNTFIFGQKDIQAPFNIDGINSVVHELGIVQLTWPTILEPTFEGRTCFPESYYKNNNKEKLLLAYTENFRRQFIDMFPLNKPLLLQAFNECGIQKMVCTTIRPTRVTFPELLTCKGCASFIADFLTYELLKNPVLLPERIISATNVLKRRRGNCFELASVLVSLLCGAGHRAYVVVGRASRDVTLCIQQRTVCPLEDAACPIMEKFDSAENPKYVVNPATEFKSQHLLDREQLRLEKEIQENKLKEAEAAKIIEEIEKPPFDELHSWRIHSWVLIMPRASPGDSVNANSLDENDFRIGETFYIEPATGCSYDTSHSEYLSVECVYNHENYYVNIQPSNIAKNFDLNNPEYWEQLLCDESSSLNATDNVDDIKVKKHLDMPGSWVEKLEITTNDIEQRYPNAKKTLNYKKSILEKYSPYSRIDGMIQKYTTYEDYEYKNQLNWTEWYENRSNFLTQTSFNHLTNNITEIFLYGRKDNMKVNQYEVIATNDLMKINREIEFFHKSRFDRLHKIKTTPSTICEYYINRDDPLLSRLIKYEKDADFNEDFTATFVEEKYNFNPENISEKCFSFVDNTVTIVFHYDDNSITKTQQCFKLPKIKDSGNYLLNGADLNFTEMGQNKLNDYKVLCKCIDDMDHVRAHVKNMESQLKITLNGRIKEKASPSLLIPLFLTERNEAAIESLAQKELKERNMKERDLSESGLWVGAPYIAREGSSTPTMLSKHLCIENFKHTQQLRQQKLKEKYNQCLNQFNNEHAWYLSNQHNISSDVEKRYLENREILKIHMAAIEDQLSRNAYLSKSRYKSLINALNLNE